MDQFSFLPNDGIMPELVRQKDWEKTSIGKPGNWPETLCTLLSASFYAETPHIIMWGKEFIQFYNDRFIPILGNKHPAALGGFAKDTWPEIWETVGAMLRNVFEEKKTIHIENFFLVIDRHEKPEECYFTFSYGPVLDCKGETLGIYVPVVDTSEEVVSRRQNKTYLNLSVATARGKDQLSLFHNTLEVLNQNQYDFPYSFIYLVNHQKNILEPLNHSSFPADQIKLANSPEVKKLVESLDKANEPVRIKTTVFSKLETPKGQWDKADPDCVVVPLRMPGAEAVVALLVCGCNPYSRAANDDLRLYNSISEQLNNELNTLGMATLEQKQELQLQKLFMQAPVAICVIKGEDFTVRLANKRMLEICGRTEKDVLHKPVNKAFPDLANVLSRDMLSEVLRSGLGKVSKGIRAELKREGKNETIYLKFDFEPLVESNGYTGSIVLIGEDITEQVEAQQVIQNEGKMLQEVFTHAPAAIAILKGSDLIYESANQLYKELVGRDNLVGLPGRKALPELSHQGIWDLVENVYRTGVPYIGREIRVNLNRGPGGSPSTGYFNYTVQPIVDHTGVIDRVLIHAVEVTAEVNTRHELEDLENRQKLAIEAADIGTFEWDIKNSEFIYSDRLARTFGFNETSDLKQKDFGDRIHPEDQKIRQEAHARAFETGVLFYEARIIWKDGSLHWVRLNGKVLYDEEHKPSKMYGTTLDITDQKSRAEELEREVKERTRSLLQMNEDLKRSEERYHKMTEEVQDYAILLLDTEGHVLNWNKGAERIKGYKEHEIVSKSFRQFYTSEDLEQKLPEKLLENARLTGRAAQEGWRVKKNGVRFWASVVITALHDEHNNIIGYSKVTRDLTERKETEEKMHQYTIDLESRNRELEQFAYVASHDLQEPLRKIRTFSDLVKNNLDNKEFAKKYFEKIESSAQRMTELIRSILNYSRLSQANDHFTEVDLEVVLRGVLNDLELVIHEKNAVVEHDPLPKVQGVALQFHQLFLNLIGNSLKFSEISPRIKVHAQIKTRDEVKHPKLTSSEHYLELIVEDNGIGFDQKYAEQVFIIFQRLQTRDAFMGTGIGLALCRRIVENHHGVIFAKSEAGKGTRFFIYLPYAG